MKGSVEKGDKSCFIVFEKLRGKVQGNIMNYFSAHKQVQKNLFGTYVELCTDIIIKRFQRNTISTTHRKCTLFHNGIITIVIRNWVIS